MNLNFCVNYAHFRKSGHIYCLTESVQTPTSSYTSVAVNFVIYFWCKSSAADTGNTREYTELFLGIQSVNPCISLVRATNSLCG